ETLQSTTGFCRNINPRNPRQVRELLINFAVKEVSAILIHQIPLVKGDDQCFTGLKDHVQHALVLLGDLLGGIDKHDAHFRSINHTASTQRSIVFMPLRILELLTQSSGINETLQLLV